MKIRLDRVRMAMDGNVYSYDVSVPVSEVDRPRQSYFIVRDGETFVMFQDAIRPAALDEMPRGMARYQAFREHQKLAKQQEWQLLQANFPELADITPGPGPDCGGLISLPGFDAGHASIVTDADVEFTDSMAHCICGEPLPCEHLA